MSRNNSGRTTPEPVDQLEMSSSEDTSVPKVLIEASSEERMSPQPISCSKHSLHVSGEEMGDTQVKERSNSASGSRTLRSNSPARLPTELSIKYRSQSNRIKGMRSIATSIAEEGTTLSDLEAESSTLEELHKDFQATHTYFELNWPAKLLDHPYFSDDLHSQEMTVYRKTKLALNRLRHVLTGGAEPQPSQHSSESRYKSKLPDITLPKFNGAYSEWPSFQEMFTSLILENDRLSNVEKLHYLRSCVEGPSAQLITNLPLVGASLQPSWELLTERYENKRLHIQAQLDQLCHIAPLTTKSAKGLIGLISTVSEARKALESLGVTDNLGDLILVHHVSRNLDRSMREAWETSLGRSLEYPPFSQLEEFINTRARALERIEATTSTHQASSRPQSTRKPATALQASSTHEPEKSRFHCDCCDDSHFVVMCPKFRNLDIPARRKVATNNRLCFNCMRRHSQGTLHIIHAGIREIGSHDSSARALIKNEPSR